MQSNVLRGALVGAVVSCACAALLAGCFGDDITYNPLDAGWAEGGKPDVVQPGSDSATDAADGGFDVAPRLLLTQSLGTSTQLAVFDLSSGTTAGQLEFMGFGTTQGSSAGPFLIESSGDVVARLDPAQPWNIRSTWGVKLGDAFDGGESYADPIQVVVTAPNKAYVLRYNRNKIAVIDPSKDVDAGAPTGTIDLGSLLQMGDGDGHVDMSGAIYDPARSRLYVALANIDLHNVDPQGFFQLCGATQSTLVAIDTTTDTLVSLGGAGPGGGVVLSGVSPQMASYGGVIFDAAGDRVLVLSTGCNDKLGDGGTGPLRGRIVEAVALKSNSTQTLLDANAQDFPGQLVVVSPTQAIIQFGFAGFGKTYLWDPSQPVLGPALSIVPDVFDYDRKGFIVGPGHSDGGAGALEVLRVGTGAPDAGATVLGTDPFGKKGNFLVGATLWP